MPTPRAATLPDDALDTRTVLDPEACYRAWQARDAPFDGRVLVGVTSTVVDCRPICPARTPGTARAAVRDRFTAYVAGDLAAVADVPVATGRTPLQRRVSAAR